MKIVDFFSRNIIYNKDGYNGFLTILFTAILMTLFEIVFFTNVGMNDVRHGLKAVTERAKLNIDAKLLGNENYCRYLYNSKKRTKHSEKNLNKYCKDVPFDDRLSNVVSSSQIPTDPSMYDVNCEADNLKKVLTSSTNTPNVDPCTLR